MNTIKNVFKKAGKTRRDGTIRNPDGSKGSRAHREGIYGLVVGTGGEGGPLEGAGSCEEGARNPPGVACAAVGGCAVPLLTRQRSVYSEGSLSSPRKGLDGLANATNTATAFARFSCNVFRLATTIFGSDVIRQDRSNNKRRPCRGAVVSPAQ